MNKTDMINELNFIKTKMDDSRNVLRRVIKELGKEVEELLEGENEDG